MTDMRLQPALEDPGRVFRDELDSKDNRLWCTADLYQGGDRACVRVGLELHGAE